MDVRYANIGMKPIHSVGEPSSDFYSRCPLGISFIPGACPPKTNIQIFRCHHGRSQFIVSLISLGVQ